MTDLVVRARVRRKRTLTEEDRADLRELIEEIHSCRFSEITQDDMSKVKEFVRITDKLKISILDKIVWVLIIVAVGLIGLWPRIRELLAGK